MFRACTVDCVLQLPNQPLQSAYQVIRNRLWPHNLPRKLASKLRCIRGSTRENRRKQRWGSVSRNVTFWKTQLYFPFPLSFILKPLIWEKSMLTFLGKLWRLQQFCFTGYKATRQIKIPSITHSHHRVICAIFTRSECAVFNFLAL